MTPTAAPEHGASQPRDKRVRLGERWRPTQGKQQHGQQACDEAVVEEDSTLQLLHPRDGGPEARRHLGQRQGRVLSGRMDLTLQAADRLQEISPACRTTSTVSSLVSCV